MATLVERERTSTTFLLAGGALGVLYAVVNVTIDDIASRGAPVIGLGALHFVVDRVVPVLVGLSLGTAVHYVRLRSVLARTAAEGAAELRARLDHTERNQAVWVVAAATLHETKNPLHAMGLLLEELESMGGSDDGREVVERLRTQWRRALAPLETLREVTRTEQEDEPPRDMLPVDQIVREALRTFEENGSPSRPIIRNCGIHTNTYFPRSTLRIALEQILENATFASSSVEISAVDLEGEVAIEVRDNGDGVPDESRLFTPSPSAKRSGLGLGLSIARALVRSLGGEVRYERRAMGTHRTVFRITLPATKESGL